MTNDGSKRSKTEKPYRGCEFFLWRAATCRSTPLVDGQEVENAAMGFKTVVFNHGQRSMIEYRPVRLDLSLSPMRLLFSLLFITLLVLPARVHGANVGDPARGYRLLTEVSFLPPDFSERVFDEVWQSWPTTLRSEAEKATPQQRRSMAFDRYGLTTRPGDQSGKPLQYVVGDDGTWTMNCFSCHGGSVYGTPYPGAPNNRFALQTMTEELRRTKFRIGEPLTRMDVGSVVIPLGTTNGTTNAVVFGQGLMQARDEQLNLIDHLPTSFVHHDMDAPPWWHFHKRPYIYIDGFAQKGHRALMQFTLVPENGPQFFRDHEDDFRDVYAYLDSLRAPKYDGVVDEVLAEQGRAVFEDNCAECHGTYGEQWTYPNRRVALSEIGTDPVRLESLQVAGREKYARSWFAHAGEPDQHNTVGRS